MLAVTEKLAAALATEIRRQCEERGWSGRELARRTGIPPAVVTYKLAGTRAFDVPDLEAIAAAFELKAADLIARAEG